MVTHKYTLICDDVRQEFNGKFIILGMYMKTITVPQLPFALPTLTFFQMLEADRLGAFTVRGQLQHVESGKIIAQAMVMLDVNQAPNGLPGGRAQRAEIRECCFCVFIQRNN
jgi:hypothetical protein